MGSEENFMQQELVVDSEIQIEPIEYRPRSDVPQGVNKSAVEKALTLLKVAFKKVPD